MIRAISKAHEFVVVDTPSHLDERMLEAFELADRVLLVTSYNLSAVRRHQGVDPLLRGARRRAATASTWSSTTPARA